MDKDIKQTSANTFGFKHSLISIGLIVLLSIIYFYLLLRPPFYDLGLMTLLLTTTAAISILFGFLIYRLGWMEHFPAMRWMLLAGYIFSGFLTFFNVFVTAQLMFTDQHDLSLAIVLLIFATGIAVVMGYFTSNTIVERLSKLHLSAQSIALGNFETRTQIPGKDELARLGEAFNHMADQLQQARIRQRQAENLRRDLIAWVSHDLQTPLSSIQAMVEALVDEVITDPGTSQRYLRNIQREVRALSSLIDELFQFAQYDAGGLTLDLMPDSLTELTHAVISSFVEIAAKKHITIDLNMDDSIEPVLMDSLQIGRVLNNLISNALNHTPHGGHIEIAAAKEGEVVLMKVSDTGTGINPEDLPYIFDRFYRGEKSRNRLTGGAGLGLAIAKGIVEAHRGEISVQSIPGKGTSFTFSLPLFH
jgi:signal transduction histidine kinase